MGNNNNHRAITKSANKPQPVTQGQSSTYPLPQNNPQGAFVAQQEFYSGPIPHPAIMSQYKELDPSFPDRILTMAEKQAESRQYVERTNANQKVYALFAATLISVLTIGGGFACIFWDKNWQGLALIIAQLATLVGALIYGKNKDKK